MTRWMGDAALALGDQKGAVEPLRCNPDGAIRPIRLAVQGVSDPSGVK